MVNLSCSSDSWDLHLTDVLYWKWIGSFSKIMYFEIQFDPWHHGLLAETFRNGSVIPVAVHPRYVLNKQGASLWAPMMDHERQLKALPTKLVISQFSSFQPPTLLANQSSINPQSIVTFGKARHQWWQTLPIVRCWSQQWGSSISSPCPPVTAFATVNLFGQMTHCLLHKDSTGVCSTVCSTI